MKKEKWNMNLLLTNIVSFYIFEAPKGPPPVSNLICRKNPGSQPELVVFEYKMTSAKNII